MARLPLTRNLCHYPESQTDLTARIYEVLGINGKKIPRDMEGVFRVDGHAVLVKRGSDKVVIANDRYVGHGPRPHRIFVAIGRRRVPATRVLQACGRQRVEWQLVKLDAEMERDGGDPWSADWRVNYARRLQKKLTRYRRKK